MPQAPSFDSSSNEPSIEDLVRELQGFSEFFHPIRLSILLLLLKHHKLVLSDLHSVLNIPWGSLKFHVEKLAEEQLIDVTREFVFSSPRVVIYLNPKGIVRYKEFFQILSKLHSSFQ